jgi:hypothetical protein
VPVLDWFSLLRHRWLRPKSWCAPATAGPPLRHAGKLPVGGQAAVRVTPAAIGRPAHAAAPHPVRGTKRPFRSSRAGSGCRAGNGMQLTSGRMRTCASAVPPPPRPPRPGQSRSSQQEPNKGGSSVQAGAATHVQMYPQAAPLRPPTAKPAVNLFQPSADWRGSRGTLRPVRVFTPTCSRR